MIMSLNNNNDPKNLNHSIRKQFQKLHCQATNFNEFAIE